MNNEVIGFSMNNNTYLYIKDMFKNVIAITNQAGVEMCQYHYDAYGNFIITPSIAGGEILGELNPIRYRSYYYDKETGLYYLKTRYYDPETCRFISMDDISYLDPQTLNGLNLYAYCLNNPIMYRDENGHDAEWWEWLGAIGRIITGIGAAIAGVLVIASGVAGAGALALACITIGAGALTINNGIADTVGLATGYNYMLDGLFQGNKNAYSWFSNIVEALAIIGSIACGGWLKYNAPRIRAYKGVSTYKYSGTNLKPDHMSRPWQGSIHLQKNVIKYGKMALDNEGWSFTINGYFNSKPRTWKLIVDIINETIWHWGPF